MPHIQVIATGSSSFDLAQKTGEPLTGRKSTLYMFPCSQSEMLSLYPNAFALREDVATFMIYGSYPALMERKAEQSKKEYLFELIQSYLLKDILALEKIKSSKVLRDIVTMLALQI
jgi:uncharacterized protein